MYVCVCMCMCVSCVHVHLLSNSNFELELEWLIPFNKLVACMWVWSGTHDSISNVPHACIHTHTYIHTHIHTNTHVHTHSSCIQQIGSMLLRLLDATTTPMRHHMTSPNQSFQSLLSCRASDIFSKNSLMVSCFPCLQALTRNIRRMLFSSLYTVLSDSCVSRAKKRLFRCVQKLCRVFKSDLCTH